jgi:outer membrane receptor protein involved in Fe transport
MMRRRCLGGPWSYLFQTLLLAIALMPVQLAQAQPSGALSGTIIESWDGRPLANVTVSVRGTTLATTSDTQGRFRIEGVPPGDQIVRFSRTGYATAVVTDVRVLAGQVTPVNGTLRPEFYEMEEYEVLAEVFEEQALAIRQDRQAASFIMDAIGSEQFTRLGVTDAADIITKVPGTTVVDGRFAVIRGLSDRYNLSLLNGAEIPTADPYRRAAQLDLIPAAMIEKLSVAKTFTPDLPGGFSGGLADITTRSFPEAYQLAVSFGLEYNTQATFNDDYLTYRGGGTDWAGLDDGSRALPAVLEDKRMADLRPPPNSRAGETPETAAARRAQADLVQQSLGSFSDYSFQGTGSAPPPNHQGSFSVGSTEMIGERKFGWFASGSYQRKYNFHDNGISARYRPDNYQAPISSYSDSRSATEIQWATVVNLAYELMPADHRIGFTFFWNQSAEDSVRQREGMVENIDPAFVVDLNQLQWIERQIHAFQLKGDHAVPNLLNMDIDWLISLADTSQDEPDLRYFNYYHLPHGAGNFIGNNSLPEPIYPARFFRSIEDGNLTARLDDRLEFPLLPANSPAAVKIGGLFSTGERDFREKAFLFEGDAGWRNEPGDPNSYFTPENIRYGETIVGVNRTNYVFDRRFFNTQINNYTGTQEFLAGYGMMEIPLTPWARLIGGARVETSDITIDAATEQAGATNSVISQVDVLPAAGVVFTLVSNMNLRLSYSETVARPTYREIAPYRAYDPFGDELVEGNPNLQITRIRNLDLRWEWFLRAGSLLSVSAFYKDLEGPIEKVIKTFGGGVVGFENREEATLYGIEFEVDTSLDVIDELLAPFHVGLNIAWIQSEVPLTATELAAKQVLFPDTPAERPLFDQSETVLNAYITYDNKRWGTTATLSLNAAGPRIALTDPGGLDIYEHPPARLDLVVTQRLSDSWRLRLSAKNLLNPDYLRTYGAESDGPIYSRYSTGALIGLSATCEF